MKTLKITVPDFDLDAIFSNETVETANLELIDLILEHAEKNGIDLKVNLKGN